MPGLGRLGDFARTIPHSHGCPGCPHETVGPAIAASPNVSVNSKGALRVGDPGSNSIGCCGPGVWTALAGSSSVFINGKPAHRLGDPITHIGTPGWLTAGSPDVNVGG